MQQVMRGHEKTHNIVVNGWAGASNPHLHPTTLTRTHKACFTTYQLMLMDRRTNGLMDRRTELLI